MKFLPGGYYLKFFDCYRPLEVQQALFDTQKANLAKQYPELSEKELIEKAQTYVSVPAPNEQFGTKHPSPHSTGGVVDLTIVKMSSEGSDAIEELNLVMKSGKEITPEVANALTKNPLFYDQVIQFVQKIQNTMDLEKSPKLQDIFSDPQQILYKAIWADIFRRETTELDMGTQFDSFEKTASPNFFEKIQKEKNLSLEEKAILDNRRLLHYVMQRAGFTGYGEEWWHFSYGDNMNAVIANKPFAKYGGTKISDKTKLFEDIRKAYYKFRLDNALSYNPASNPRNERTNRGRGYIRQ